MNGGDTISGGAAPPVEDYSFIDKNNLSEENHRKASGEEKQHVKRKVVKVKRKLVKFGGFSHVILDKIGRAFKAGGSKNFNIVKDDVKKSIYLNPIGENIPHQYTMIFLHGLGDSAEMMIDLFSDSRCNPEWTPKNCRIVLP